jgi:hypothetical protein
MGAGASADKRKEIQVGPAWLARAAVQVSPLAAYGGAQALSKETGLSPLEVGALAQRFQQVHQFRSCFGR